MTEHDPSLYASVDDIAHELGVHPAKLRGFLIWSCLLATVVREADPSTGMKQKEFRTPTPYALESGIAIRKPGARKGLNSRWLFLRSEVKTRWRLSPEQRAAA